MKGLLIGVSFFSMVILGCSSTPRKVALKSEFVGPTLNLLDDSFFSPHTQPLPLSQVFKLTREQKSRFLDAYYHPDFRSKKPKARVYSYLKNHLESFNFYSDTLTASESLSNNQGNCLSLAILTKTLADLVGVEVAYELVETTPIYQKEGDIILSSQHVRTLLSDPKSTLGTNQFSLFRGRIIIDYFPSGGTRVLRSVDEQEFFAMYYRNKAAEALIRNKDSAAFWNLKNALKQNPNDEHAINMLALLHERTGYPGYAENIYRYGLFYAKEKLDLLNNYHVLLKNQNRLKEAKLISEKLAAFDDPNPFKWISLGNKAYNSKDYRRAIAYYRKAGRLAPYLHESYAGVAHSQYQLGYLGSARSSFKKAIKNTHNQKTLLIYQAKFNMLTQLLAQES